MAHVWVSLKNPACYCLQVDEGDVADQEAAAPQVGFSAAAAAGSSSSSRSNAATADSVQFGAVTTLVLFGVDGSTKDCSRGCFQL